MKRNSIAVAMICSLAFVATGCGKSLEDKFKGTWTATKAMCNTTDMTEFFIVPGSSKKFTFEGTTASSVDSDADCIKTEAATVTYGKDDKSISLLFGAVTCSTEGCALGTGDAETCNAEAADAQATAMNFTVAFSDDNKTLTLSTPMNCNQEEGEDTFTMTLTKD